MTNPLILFLLIFVGAPLGELYLMIQVGSSIGALPTILLTLATAVAGGLLMRMQGLATAMRANEALRRGEMPAMEMLEGLVLLLSGLLLLLPGFVTDAIGFLGLIPPLRRLLLLAVLKRLRVQTQVHPRTDTGDGVVIEGEYRRERPESPTEFPRR